MIKTRNIGIALLILSLFLTIVTNIKQDREIAELHDDIDGLNEQIVYIEQSIE